MNITKGKIDSAQKVVVYGPEGVGKSTFASFFPDPTFIDTEGSTKKLDVARTPKPGSWTMILEQVRYFRDNPGKCKTLIIDTADWAERLCVEHICSKSQKSGIEDFGYGKGYTYLEEEFGRLLNLLEEVVERGVNIVVTAHASMRKFEQPDEMGAYDRWELKLEKKTAPLLKEWADMILFANYKTYVVNVDGQGAQKGKNKAQGNKRVMYATHHPCWDAKNRHDLPEELPFEFQAIAHCIPNNTTTQAAQQPVTNSMPRESIFEPIKEDAVRVVDRVGNEKIITSEQYNQDVERSLGGPDIEKMKSNLIPDYHESQKNIPKALAELMIANEVLPEEIQKAVASKGYYPENTPIGNYDSSFISGVLVGAWPAVFGMIKDIRMKNGQFVPTEPEEIPFN